MNTVGTIFVSTLLLSTSVLPVGHRTSRTRSTRSRAIFVQTLDITKCFSAGQYIVHVAVPTGFPRDYVEIPAKDLVATYTYNTKGHLLDKTIWVATTPRMRNYMKSEAAFVVDKYLSCGNVEPWLRSNLSLGFVRFPTGFGIIALMPTERRLNASLL